MNNFERIRAALPAGLVLVAFAPYLWLVRIPSLERESAALRAPQSYAAFFLRPVVRGEDQTVTLSPGAAFLGLAVDVPPGSGYPSYRCELLEESGRRAAVLSVAVPAEPGAPIHGKRQTNRILDGRQGFAVSEAAALDRRGTPPNGQE